MSDSDANLLFIHALTGLHPGGGTAIGVVDLPVQRERHTRWPMIAGASLKGVLRGACRPQTGQDEDRDQWLAAFGPELAAFGPETEKASDFAGALAFTDARLLAFPVRSLRGVFAWVTCPTVLDRLRRDAKLLADNESPPPEPPRPKRGHAACPRQSDNLIAAPFAGAGSGQPPDEDSRLLLEEFEFRRAGDDSGTAAWVADRAIPESDSATAERLTRNLIVLHDDDFTHFARHATEVIARVGLDYERKTARKGALFYEEFLPPETLLYSVVLATSSRRPGTKHNATDMLGFLQDYVKARPIVQIGADQTIGKGLCAMRLAGRRMDGGRETSQ